MSDFAKILHAKDGAQVLFFMESSDDGPIMVKMTEFHGVTARLTLEFHTDDEGYEARRIAFDGADDEEAEAFRRQVRDLMGEAQ